MQHFNIFRKRRVEREAEKGQVLVEGLLLMLFILSVFLVLVNFMKSQNKVLKKYELPAKIKNR